MLSHKFISVYNRVTVYDGVEIIVQFARRKVSYSHITMKEYNLLYLTYIIRYILAYHILSYFQV